MMLELLRCMSKSCWLLASTGSQAWLAKRATPCTLRKACSGAAHVSTTYRRRSNLSPSSNSGRER